MQGEVLGEVAGLPSDGEQLLGQVASMLACAAADSQHGSHPLRQLFARPRGECRRLLQQP